MDVRKITLEEMPQAREIQSLAFLFPAGLEELHKQLQEKPEETDLDNTWGCFDEGGKMISSLVNFPFAMHYDGHQVGLGCIGNVCTLPEARMQGGIRALFAGLFADEKAKGIPFSALYPFSHKYYRQFGYELCHEARIFKIPTLSLKPYRQTGNARLHRPGDDEAGIRAVYDAFASRYTYAVARNDLAWRRLLRGDPLKAESYCYVLSNGGVDTAYCIYHTDRMPVTHDAHLILKDLAYRDAAALHDLLGFLYRMSPQYKMIHMEAPDGLEPSALVEEPYDVEGKGFVRTMARVLDIPQALRLMRHPGGSGQYSLFVQDDFLPENTGVYRVAFGPEGVRVEHAPQGEADLSCSVQTLAQLCLGYLPLSMAALKQDVTVRGNEAVLSRVFIHKDKMHPDRY